MGGGECGGASEGDFLSLLICIIDQGASRDLGNLKLCLETCYFLLPPPVSCVAALTNGVLRLVSVRVSITLCFVFSFVIVLSLSLPLCFRNEKLISQWLSGQRAGGAS